MSKKRTTLGVIVGNRGFFPAHLCDEGRKVILQVLEEEGIDDSYCFSKLFKQQAGVAPKLYRRRASLF